ncbi:MAG: hypothetical protein OHK0023_27620 [Anaerolineae bacterium]
MRILKVVLALWIMLTASIVICPSQTVGAQLDGQLIILQRGDLWAYDEASNTLRQLTRWGYNQAPVISPDGQRIAYASYAEIAAPVLQRTGESPNIPPANIWIWVLPTSQALRVASQPPNASFGTGAPNETFVRRFTPAWSPDSALLTWVESTVVNNVDNYELVVFDVAANAVRARTKIALNGAQNILGVDAPDWGQTGIALRIPFIATDGNFGEAIQVYDSVAQLRSEIRPQTGNQSASIMQFGWVTLQSSEYVGIFYSSGAWQLVNPINGTSITPPGLLEIYSPSGASGVSVYFTLPAGGLGYNWFGAANGQSVSLPFSGTPEQIAISPTGQAIAYASDAVYILRGGQTKRIPGTDAVPQSATFVAWGYNKWRVQGASVVLPPTLPPPPPPASAACILPARLAPGLRARVTLFPSQANALNSQPSRPSRNPQSISLGNIPPGGVFTVLNGPVCNEGYFWYQVNYNGRVGWTAEGENGVYWLEPVTTAGACPPALPPRLKIGSQGRVTPGTPNAVRDQPSANNAVSRVVGSIPGGAVFNVLNGPVCADGYAWWQVSYLGITGWTAEGEGVTYWLEPLNCGFNLPSRLTVGGRGRVTPGLANAVRAQPSTNRSFSPVLGEIPAGGVFNVIGGPQCGDGYTWWQVNYNGLLGWTAEGNNGVYWLEPIP